VSDLSSIPVAVVAEPPVIHRLGEVPYAPTLELMQTFTRNRDSNTRDELWLLEHPPVYTAGIAAKTEHWPRVDNNIPVVRIDRGGQITYHGPGQLVAYLLLDLRRRLRAQRCRRPDAHRFGGRRRGGSSPVRRRRCRGGVVRSGPGPPS
jgi:lipoate-protein ligase B